MTLSLLQDGKTSGLLTFSPDGKILASAGWDKIVILWDVATRKPLGQPLTGNQGEVFRVAFSPDGKTLASASRDRTVVLWNVALDAWADKACAIANRNFTCEEWRSHMGVRQYRKTCEKISAPECP